MARKDWGFDTRTINRTLRPQDDFYQYVNDGWLKKTKVPKDEARWGIFNILHTKTQKELREIVDGLLRTSRVPVGSATQLVGDLYRSGMDMRSRNKLGIKPLDPIRKEIAMVETRNDLVQLTALLHRLGIGTFWGASVDQDQKKSETYLLHLFQGGIGLPDRDYYLLDTPETLRLRTAYRQHIARMLKLLGYSASRIRTSEQAIMSIETQLAKASMRKEDVRDPHKTYHKMSVATFERIAPLSSWGSYLRRLGAGAPSSLMIMQPDFFTAAIALIARTPLEDLKAYMEFHVFTSIAGLLSEEAINANFVFYGKALTGRARLLPLWRRVLSNVNGSLGDALGQLYVEKHFSKEAKLKIDELIEDVFAAYKERIRGLDWMGGPTKKQALKKLAMMVRKIGYPKRWRSYRGLTIDPKDYFGNAVRTSLHEHTRQIRKLGKPVDREEWFMYPQEVNAYFNPGINEIAFPAAILQAPLFDPRQDDALNYGAIGAVIGHEITHGFDDKGSLYDGRGNLKSWWTKEDRLRFEKKAELIQKQFSGFTLHGVRVNGKLTLGENIADLGGDSIAFLAYHRHLRKIGRKTIEGFTPEQRFFLGIAQDWREVARPEVTKLMMLSDPHAPDKFRVNGPLANMSEFYEAFKVRKGDKLYRGPKARAKIW